MILKRVLAFTHAPPATHCSGLSNEWLSLVSYEYVYVKGTEGKTAPVTQDLP